MTYDKFLKIMEPFDYFAKCAVEGTNELFERAPIEVLTLAMATDNTPLTIAIVAGVEILTFGHFLIKKLL